MCGGAEVDPLVDCWGDGAVGHLRDVDLAVDVPAEVDRGADAVAGEGECVLELQAGAGGRSQTGESWAGGVDPPRRDDPCELLLHQHPQDPLQLGVGDPSLTRDLGMRGSAWMLLEDLHHLFGAAGTAQSIAALRRLRSLWPGQHQPGPVRGQPEAVRFHTIRESRCLLGPVGVAGDVGRHLWLDDFVHRVGQGRVGNGDDTKEIIVVVGHMHQQGRRKRLAPSKLAVGTPPPLREGPGVQLLGPCLRVVVLAMPGVLQEKAVSGSGIASRGSELPPELRPLVPEEVQQAGEGQCSGSIAGPLADERAEDLRGADAEYGPQRDRVQGLACLVGVGRLIQMRVEPSGPTGCRDGGLRARLRQIGDRAVAAGLGDRSGASPFQPQKTLLSLGDVVVDVPVGDLRPGVQAPEVLRKLVPHVVTFLSPLGLAGAPRSCSRRVRARRS